jgi:hypothetical protein
MTTYHDPDPTPPHGTPRPLSIHWYTSRDETFTVTLVYSVERNGWEVHTYDTVTGEIIEYPHTDYRSAYDCPAFADEHHARSLAVAVVLSFEAGLGSKSAPEPEARFVSAPLSVPSHSSRDEDLLHALDELEDACVNAREWLTQTIQVIRSEQYTPDEALRDSIALSFPETSVVHSVLVALGALASFTDSNLHPFGGALDR